MNQNLQHETATETAVKFFCKKNPAVANLICKLNLSNVDETTGVVIDKDFFNEFNFTKTQLQKMKLTVDKQTAAAAPEVEIAPQYERHDLTTGAAQGIYKGQTPEYKDKADATKTFRFPLIENEGKMYSLNAWKDLQYKLQNVTIGNEIYVEFVSRNVVNGKTIIKVKVIDLTAQTAEGGELFEEDEQPQPRPRGGKK